MKILKKISLGRGLSRIAQPSLFQPKFPRDHYYISAPYKLTSDQQLHKYSMKPKYFEFKWFLLIIFGGFAGIFWKVYEQQLYINQLDTIYRYRFHQQEVPPFKIYSRLYLMKFILFLETNYFISGFMTKQNMGTSTLDYYTEAIIRYKQYKHYTKNKDRKFDFLDIGVLQKFPYPKRVQSGME